MCKRLVFCCVVLGFVPACVLQAANIVWVSDNKTPAAGVPADQAWVDVLTTAGHTVDLGFRNREGRALTAAEVATLNAADLIIVSRDVDSGQYASDAAEITQWNNITAPILLQIAHFARNNRWKWANTATTADAQPALEAVIPSHPIFKGVPLDANNQIAMVTANCSLLATTDVGAGTLIARRADNDQAWIVEWAPGVEFYAGAVQKAGGKRLLFSGGGTAGVSDGTYNYTDNGKKVFLNAVNYLLGIGDAPIASEPNPADGATDIPRDAVLGWEPAAPDYKHNVYLGTECSDVNSATTTSAGVLVSEGQTETTYEPANALAYGGTYCWRIDEVNGVSGEVFKGDVWSFTVEPYAYPITKVTATASSAQAGMGPENTVNGSGLDAQDQHSVEGTQMWLTSGAQPNWIQYEFDQAYKVHEMWVWNSNQLVEAFIGFGAKDVTMEYSLDGAAWTALTGVPEFAKATASPTYTHNTTVSFDGALAKYVKLTINNSWGGLATSGLSEVRFFHAPVQAREPVPADAATEIDIDATLNWRPGREAASHKIYFGKDKDAVTNGTVAAQTVADHSFSPAAMEYAQTYYWRVDEVNEAMTPGTHAGSVWTFTTRAFAVIDDFESYTNNEGSRIYESWIDGVTDGKSGSTVGYFEAPFAEQTILHGGKQSMPLAYDNTTMAYSEATLTFDGSRNWTANGVKSLSLYIRGATDNTGKLYLKINSTKVPYNGNEADIAKLAWLPWNIDLSKVGGNLSKVNSLVIGIEGSGAKGILYVDDIRLYPKTPQFVTPADPGTASLLALYAFEGNANDTSGHKLNGTIKDGQLVASGRPNGGSAVQVNKAGYVDLGNPPLLDFSTGDWTLAAWYKTAITGTGDANKGTILAKGGDTAGGHRYALIMSETTEGMVSLVTDDDVTKYVVNSTNKTNDDKWHFVVGQREGATLRIYIDGQLEGTTAATATYSLAGTKQHNAYVGASTDHTNNVLYKLYNGLIDDVRIYNKALSEGEVLWLAGQTTPVAKPF